MNNLYFPMCAVLIDLLIVLVFYSKKRIKSDETKSYSLLIRFGLFESILACVLVILMNLYGTPSYIYYIHRIDYILILFWVWGLFDYVLIIASTNNIKLRTMIQKVTIGVNLAISICFFFLKVNVINENGIIDTNGPAMNLLFGFLAIYIIAIIIMTLKTLIKNIRNSTNKKFLPLLVLAILAIASLIIRSIAPEVLLISFMAAYADLIMFFTIENPDLKMIYELNKNKKLLESMSEEKTSFLFNMSQETRKPIDNILEVKKLLENEHNLNSIQTGLNVIENNAKGLKNTVDNILDMSNINSSKLVVHTETYNIYSLLSLCIKNIESKLNKNVSFRSNISKNIPNELFGDSFKLRQVLTSILVNASKYTKEGYIELRVNEIVKYDVCRLVIEVEDSGCGLTIDMLNQLLKSSSKLEDTDLIKMDGLDIDLKLAFKIIGKLGGFINIKSEEGKGSTFTIIVDQKIKINEDMYYSKYVFNNKKVIAISNNMETLKTLNGLSEQYNFELLTTMFSNDLVQRIKDGEAFDLIILEDEMKPDTALSILKQLQEQKKGFKTPVVVMLGDDKIKIKNNYIEDGFDNYIIKSDLKQEYDKIVKKYI